MRRQKKGYGTGSLWLMMVYVAVCLTVFAILALVTAKRDERLIDITLQSISSFYEADSKAKTILAIIHDSLQESERGMDEVIGQIEISVGGQIPITFDRQSQSLLDVIYTVPCGERQMLFVKLQLQNDHKNKGYQILEWVVQPKQIPDYEIHQEEFGELRIGG